MKFLFTSFLKRNFEGERKMKNEKGITLISLVITIIVLLILATISINAGTGTIRYSNYNKAKAEMQAMQDNVNSWYDEYANIDKLLAS